MKFSTILCCALIAAGSACTALAAPQGRGPGYGPSGQEQRPGPGRGREAEMPAPQRDMRGAGEEDRGRMNSEERRQLRRDIQDAGKDIYPSGPHNQRDGRRSRGR